MLYSILSYLNPYYYYNCYYEEEPVIVKKKFIPTKPEVGVNIHDKLNKELKDYFYKKSKQ